MLKKRKIRLFYQRLTKIHLLLRGVGECVPKRTKIKVGKLEENKERARQGKIFLTLFTCKIRRKNIHKEWSMTKRTSMKISFVTDKQLYNFTAT